MYHHPPWGLGVIGVIILIIPFWRICKRIGWNPWLSLLIAVPLANFIFVYFLAFSDWPIQRNTAAPGGPTGATPA
jgi:hypothetical protein